MFEKIRENTENKQNVEKLTKPLSEKKSGKLQKINKKLKIEKLLPEKIREITKNKQKIEKWSKNKINLQKV